MESISCKTCGLVDDYSIKERGQHRTAFCNGCGAYIKNISYQPPKLYFGKFKDREIASLTNPNEVSYLRWLVIQPNLKDKLKQQISTHLNSL
jgi:hypothetical protein